jgi:hypothetical protein
MRYSPPSPPASFTAMAPAGQHLRTAIAASRGILRLAALAALAASVSNTTSAFTVNITAAAPKTIYLQVGVGSFTANYNNNGTPQNNATINVVSATVPSAALGNGTAQAMTANTATTNSFFDNYPFCTVPAGQLYIGGFYRTTGAAGAAAQVTATVPAALTNAAGSTIPFSKISWTSGGNGDGSNPQPFPAGTFVNGGVQNVGSMAGNTWNESCWTFSYLNNTVPAAGTFTGRVVYTMTSP